MEQQQVGGNEEQGGGGKTTTMTTSLVCRKSIKRWTPTIYQIRILKELYYKSGVRSPTAEQIQLISAELRQYGKIEDKNVFHWLKNHKAREGQKKRLTSDHHHHHHPIYSNFPNINPGNFASSSAAGYGSVAMEINFGECSITPNANVGGQNLAWFGVDPYPSPYPFLEMSRSINDQTLLQTAEEEEEVSEIKTLPLFPMHGDAKQDWHHRSEDAIAAASLELSLNPYAAGFRH